MANARWRFGLQKTAAVLPSGLGRRWSIVIRDLRLGFGRKSGGVPGQRLWRGSNLVSGGMMMAQTTCMGGTYAVATTLTLLVVMLGQMQQLMGMWVPGSVVSQYRIHPGIRGNLHRTMGKGGQDLGIGRLAFGAH